MLGLSCGSKPCPASVKDRKSVLIPTSFPVARGTCRQRSGSRGTMQRWALVAILAVLPGQGCRRRLRSVLIFVTLNLRVVGRNRTWLCQHCQEIPPGGRTALVTGAEPVPGSLQLLVGSQGRSTGLWWVAELGSAALRVEEGQEEKCEATLVCGAAARWDHPQHLLHTAWNHPQSLAGLALMGSRASKGLQRLPSILGGSFISMGNSS